MAGLAKTQYINRLSTVMRGNDQEILVWAEKDGQRISSSDCEIVVKDAAGVTKWSSSSTTPNTDGVYRFINPMTITPNHNFYVIIKITVAY